MNSRAQVRLLPDGRRLHLHDGPIHVILEGFGETREIEQAYRAAAIRFTSILDELCSELPFLRRPAQPDSKQPEGPVARQMLRAVLPFCHDTFITPMAAVAGAVAEELLGVMTSAATLKRAYVNDGGDIALHLAPGEQFIIGMIELPATPSLFGTTTIHFDDPIRGIATSGWRGRSFSLGIADSVTVVASDAALADAAATLIANAVDLPGHPAIRRIAASDLAPDSDLGTRLVTQTVGNLTNAEIGEALDSGIVAAESFQRRGVIHSAALTLQGTVRIAEPARHRPLAHASAANRRTIYA
ncbi:MAG TPA: UPF0280 family protein [Terriglobales bacterium]|nr:UPF0280 family protein [Terriglobales bacterium]